MTHSEEPPGVLVPGRPLLLPEGRDQTSRRLVDALFDGDECDGILASAPVALDRAGIEGVEEPGEVRSASVTWIAPTTDTEWIFARLGDAVLESNRMWGIDLVGFEEDVQIVCYSTVGDHYDWHRDGLEDAVSTRKITIVVQLSDPGAYEGSDLRFIDDPCDGDDDSEFGGDLARRRARGSAVVFPSWEYHRVTPLRSGAREALVAWVSGPPFR